MLPQIRTKLLQCKPHWLGALADKNVYFLLVFNNWNQYSLFTTNELIRSLYNSICYTVGIEYWQHWWKGKEKSKQTATLYQTVCNNWIASSKQGNENPSYWTIDLITAKSSELESYGSICSENLLRTWEYIDLFTIHWCSLNAIRAPNLNLLSWTSKPMRSKVK